jgi:hypothetical protein
MLASPCAGLFATALFATALTSCEETLWSLSAATDFTT